MEAASASSLREAAEPRHGESKRASSKPRQSKHGRFAVIECKIRENRAGKQKCTGIERSINMAGRASRFLFVSIICTLIVMAVGCAKPKVAVQVSRNQIQQGEDVKVTWTSEDAKAVTLNGEKVDKSGSKVFNPNQTTDYTAVAKRGDKEVRDSKTVNVNGRSAHPSIQISADKDAIQRGQSTTLRWSSTNSDRVSITDLGAVPPSGSRSVSPADSTTYTATATGPGGTDSASTRVTITEDAGEVTSPRNATGGTSMGLIFNQWVTPIYFDYDKADILPESKDRLRRAAGWLTQAPNRSIVFRIEGNCDPRGTEEYNLGLGERRAQAAKEFLASLGVESSRMSTVSYGREHANGNDEGSPSVVPSWAHDRRDEFIYISGGTPPKSQ